MQQWKSRHKLTNRPYQIERELGQGDFGITYKAFDNYGDRINISH